MEGPRRTPKRWNVRGNGSSEKRGETLGVRSKDGISPGIYPEETSKGTF